MLNLQSGILGYIAKFWRGFFPLLIVELEKPVTEKEDAENPENLGNLENPGNPENPEKNLPTQIVSTVL